MAEQVHVVRLPIGTRGFNGSNNKSQMGLDELVDATNISYDQNLIQKEAGAVKWNATTLESGADIIAGHYWEPTVSNKYDVVYVNGKLLRDTNGDGTFVTTLRSSMSTTKTSGQFIDAGQESGTDNRKLFFVNGEDTVSYADGTGATMTVISNPSADWSSTNQPSTGCVHEDRLWLAGNINDPNRVYYSLTSDHAHFITGSGAGSISVFPGEGGNIKALASFKGFLVVFKESGIYYVDTRDSIITNWKTARASRGIGTLSPQSLDIVDDDILFIDQVGYIRQLSTLTEFGSIATKNLTDEHAMIHWIQKHVTYTSLSKARLCYYPTRREVHVAYPIDTSTFNNIRVVIDISEVYKGHGIKYRLITRDDVYSIWRRLESAQPGYAFGDGSGFVWKGDQKTRTKDGAYNSRFETAPTTFADQDPKLGSVNKHGHYLELVVEPAGSGTLYVDILWDNITYQTVSYNLEPEGVALGTFVIGTDVLSGESTLKNIRKRIVGQGRRFAMAGRHSDDSKNFKIAEAYLGFKLADHRLHHGEG